MENGLLKYVNEDIDFFYSEEMMEENELDLSSLEMLSSDIKDYMYKKADPKQKEIIDVNSKKRNLERIAILYAHGGTIGENWYYFNKEDSYPIQKWINKNDGKYKLIILTACNAEAQEITSKKSCIIAPNQDYSKKRLMIGEVQIELYLPESGYVNNYLIDHELEKIKK